MPLTDKERANFFDRRVIGATQLNDQTFTFLESALKRHTKGMMTGATPSADKGGWLALVTLVDGAGANDLTFGDMFGTDGNGEFISVVATDARITDVPFQNTAAVTYYCGVTVAELPVGLAVDTVTQQKNYNSFKKDIGHRAEPTVVVDNGGTITFTLGNHTLDGADTYAGRTASVFLKTPEATTAAVAIETVAVTGNQITTAGVLGQVAVSTTASSYEVILNGPTITRNSALVTMVGWAFVGTVVGGTKPRTISTAAQVSIIPLAEIGLHTSTMLAKGWISVPVTSFQTGGTVIRFNAGASVFVGGRVVVTPQVDVGSLGNNNDIYIYWNSASGTYTATTAWDTADATGNVPVYFGRTDGAGVLTALTSVRIGKAVASHNEGLVYTVSSEPSHFPTFATLEEALGHAYSMQQGSGVDPRGPVIEIIGDVALTASVTSAQILSLKNVTIRGRGAGQGRFSTGSSSVEGARLTWSFNASLFLLNNGSPVMRNWRFENLTFAYSGTATANNVSIIEAPNGSGSRIEGVTFVDCVVDGNESLKTNDTGSGNGQLPHVIFNDANTLRDVGFFRCGLYTTDAIVYSGAAGGGIRNLKFHDVQKVESPTTPALFSNFGFVVDLADGQSTGVWEFKSCSLDRCRGQAIMSIDVDRLWVTDCTFEQDLATANLPLIDLGDATNFGTDVANIWIHDNRIRRVSATNPTNSVIHIRSDGALKTFIHDNAIEDADSVGGAAAIRLESGVGQNLSEVVIHGNIITGSTVGIDGSGDLNKCLIYGNQISCGTIPVEALISSENIIFGNILQATDAASVGINIHGDENILLGNLIAVPATGDMINMSTTADSSVVIGNQATTGDIVSAGDDNVFVGNLTVGSFDWNDGGTNNVVVGNRFNSMILDGDNGVISGNFVNASVTTEANASSLAISGNVFRTSFLQNNSNGGNSIAGNVFLGTSGVLTMGTSVLHAFTGNVCFLPANFGNSNGVVVGNTFPNSFTLTGTSNDLAAVGNYSAVTPTDAGVTNILANNTDT